MITAFLVYGLYPAWLIAGALDYLCHRRTAIERTSGAQENRLHLLQYLLIATGFGPLLFFEITRSLLLLSTVAVILHSVAAYLDTAYTQGRRCISPFEQLVHGYMDVLPIVATCLLVWSQWPPADTGAWTVRLRDPELPSLPLAAGIGSFLLFGGGALMEEWVRTHRSPSIDSRTLTGRWDARADRSRRLCNHEVEHDN